MPRCPKCGEEIDHLVYWEKAWRRAEFEADGEYHDWETHPTDSFYYACPCCGEKLFRSEEKALNFLKRDKK